MNNRIEIKPENELSLWTLLMARLFTLPRVTPIVSGAKANFFLTGTTTRTNTFTDSALATPHANPVIADAAGVFAAIYLDPDIVYKLTLDDTNDALIYTEDPVQDAMGVVDGWDTANHIFGISLFVLIWLGIAIWLVTKGA